MKANLILFFCLSLILGPACKKSETPQTGTVKVYVPSAFYPGSVQPCPNNWNPDCNATFHVVVSDITKLSTYSMMVFSADGTKMFDSTDPARGWDGRYNGIDSPQNTYYYRIAYTDSNGDSFDLKGEVFLVR